MIGEAFGDVDLSALRLDGEKVSANVLGAITDVVLERPIDGAPTLTIDLEDPKRTLLNSGIFNARVTTQVDNHSYELAAVKKTGDGITATFEDLTVAALRRHTTPLKVGAGSTSRVEFVRRLVAEEPWVRFVIGNGAISPVKVELARGNPDQPAPTGPGAQDPENTWDASGRILDEIGWRRFIGAPGEFHVHSDEAVLAEFEPAFVFQEFSGGVDYIDYDFDIGKPVQSISLGVWSSRWFAAPGVVVAVNVPGPAFGMKLLVATIKRSLFTDLAEVTLTGPRPTLPEPEEPPGPDMTTVDLGDAEGTSTPNEGKPGSGSDVGTQTRQGAVSTAGFAWPVQGTITSGFGTRNGRPHEGIDIAVPQGTAVIASKDGTVTFAGSQSGYGNVAYITHGSPTGTPRFEASHEQETRYGHLSRFNCRRGQVVRRGDVIGYSGGTPGTPGAGNASGPHLHFEIRIGGVARNPMEFLQGTASTEDTYKKPVRGVF